MVFPDLRDLFFCCLRVYRKWLSVVDSLGKLSQMQRQDRPVMLHWRSVCNATANAPSENTKKQTRERTTVFTVLLIYAWLLGQSIIETQSTSMMFSYWEPHNSSILKPKNWWIQNTERRNKRSSRNQTNLGLMHWIVLKYAGQTTQCKHIMLQGTWVAEQSGTKDTLGYSCTLVHVLA